MEELGPAPPAPSADELIDVCGPSIMKLMQAEMSDESDIDWVYWLWTIHKNYLYYRDLQTYAPSIYEGLANFTSVAGVTIAPFEDDGSGMYDYSQNYFRGYCRKLEAVLGTRMPNAIAVPDNAGDENDIRAAATANDAAEWMRQKCNLQMMILQLVFGLYNFGTNFWNIEWVVNGDKYGFKDEPQIEPQDQQLGGGGFDCPQCGADVPAPDSSQRPEACPQCGASMQGAQFRPSQTAQVPVQTGVNKVEKGGLEISLHDGSEIRVPLESDSVNGNCPWLRKDYERHKSYCLKKYGKKARQVLKDDSQTAEESTSSQLGRNIRSSFGSPIGIFRTYRENYWTISEICWPPAMYQCLDDNLLELMEQNFPKGCKITTLRGKVVNMEDYAFPMHWQECKPEPSKRIMADPLGNDWITPQDILNNTLNQVSETIERSNDPGFADPTRLDFDAFNRRRDTPCELFPLLPRAGQSIADSIYRPEPVRHSDQIVPFREQVKQGGEEISGETEAIWGGDTSDPTARQTELKTNAAIRTLGVIWTMIGKSLEKVYEKSCRILAEYEEGVLSFSRKDQFGSYQQVAVRTEDLKSGKFHFEADEAVPMTWGQQRDLLMWMLDKPAELLNQWGFSDPLNVPEFKRLLGMPGERTPLMDDRDKAMNVIGRLAKEKPAPGQPGAPDPATGMPGPTGPPQPSVPPDWEDNHAFCASLAKAYLTQNFIMAQQQPDGYQNIVLWGQAHEQMANAPQAPPPPRTSIAVSLKGEDLGDKALTDALTQSGVIPQGDQTTGDQARQQENQAKAQDAAAQAQLRQADLQAKVQGHQADLQAKAQDHQLDLHSKAQDLQAKSAMHAASLEAKAQSDQQKQLNGMPPPGMTQ